MELVFSTPPSIFEDAKPETTTSPRIAILFFVRYKGFYLLVEITESLFKPIESPKRFELQHYRIQLQVSQASDNPKGKWPKKQHSSPTKRPSEQVQPPNLGPEHEESEKPHDGLTNAGQMSDGKLKKTYITALSAEKIEFPDQQALDARTKEDATLKALIRRLGDCEVIKIAGADVGWYYSLGVTKTGDTCKSQIGMVFPKSCSFQELDRAPSTTRTILETFFRPSINNRLLSYFHSENKYVVRIVADIVSRAANHQTCDSSKIEISVQPSTPNSILEGFVTEMGSGSEDEAEIISVAATSDRQLHLYSLPRVDQSSSNCFTLLGKFSMDFNKLKDQMTPPKDFDLNLDNFKLNNMFLLPQLNLNLIMIHAAINQSAPKKNYPHIYLLISSTNIHTGRNPLLLGNILTYLLTFDSKPVPEPDSKHSEDSQGLLEKLVSDLKVDYDKVWIKVSCPPLNIEKLVVLDGENLMEGDIIDKTNQGITSIGSSQVRHP